MTTARSARSEPAWMHNRRAAHKRARFGEVQAAAERASSPSVGSLKAVLGSGSTSNAALSFPNGQSAA